MEIKMCTCPNGHYYNADIYSSCPECGAAAPAPMGGTAGGYGGGDFPKTSSPNQGFNAAPIGATEPVFNNNFGGAQPIGKTVPAAPSYNGGMNATIPINPKEVPAGGPATPFSVPTQSAADLSGGSSVQTEPVVGWLVCIEGPLRGVDFRLHDGYNFIGREEGDIHIQGDNAISRQKHAVVAFYAKRNSFHVGPADGRNIIELNDEPVFNHTEMKNYDVITVGNTKLMLVGLCGSHFSWTAGVNNG